MIRYDDLIGIPWDDADCRQIALMALDRIGVDVPARAAWEAARVDVSDEDYAAILEQSGAEWFAKPEEVPLRIGDVIVSDAPIGDARTGPHLSVVIDEDRGLALTTSKKMGSMVTRTSMIHEVRAIWRRA